MRNLHKSCLYALMLAIMIFAMTACNSSEKEDQAYASNNQYSETSQAPSGSVAPSSESATASPEISSASASESASAPESASASESTSASESASVEPSAQPSKEGEAKDTASPSASAEESHEHESTPEPSASKPSPEPSEKPTQEEAEAADKVTIVEIKDFAFSPDKVTISKGSTVYFINRDTIKHTAKADGGEFDTGLLGKDVTGEVKFEDAGTFTYFCSPHPGMTGTIVVEDK